MEEAEQGGELSDLGMDALQQGQRYDEIFFRTEGDQGSREDGRQRSGDDDSDAGQGPSLFAPRAEDLEDGLGGAPPGERVERVVDFEAQGPHAREIFEEIGRQRGERAGDGPRAPEARHGVVFRRRRTDWRNRAPRVPATKIN